MRTAKDANCELLVRFGVIPLGVENKISNGFWGLFVEDFLGGYWFGGASCGQKT